MVRDDDLLRDVLVAMEANHDPLTVHIQTMNMTAQERLEYFHVKLLEDAGYVEEMKPGGGAWRITNAGHDFLALTRTNEAWSAVKSAAANLGGASVRMLGEIAYALAKDKLRAMGLPLD